MRKKDYLPENVEFFSKEHEFDMPKELFDDLAGNEDAIRNALKDNFDYVQLERKLQIERLMDDSEREELRNDYNAIMENQIPVLESKLAEVTELAKRMVADAKASLQAATTEVRDMVYAVRRNRKEFVTVPEKTYRIAHDKKYYYYSLVNNRCKLFYTEDIPTIEQGQLYGIIARNEVSNNDLSRTETIDIGTAVAPNKLKEAI